MSKPTFLVIGAKKAASTWLYSILRQYPDIWCPPVKELHYFLTPQVLASAKARTYESVLNGNSFIAEKDRWFYHNYLLKQENNDEWYFSLFPDNEQLVCGDVDPNLCSISEEHIQQVYTANPNFKLIIVLRDPVQRIWSHFKMIAELKKISIGDIVHSNNSAYDHVFDKSSYKKMLSRWLKYFPKENILFLNYDDIKHNPLSIQASIEQFLGVEHHPIDGLGEVVNPSAMGGNEIPPKVYEILAGMMLEHKKYACDLLGVGLGEMLA
ncbi:MAG: sulfotransferase [Spongiibacteraceae bacterium]|nr:sulfotransferase [Spongiibacteraceae bacterium]